MATTGRCTGRGGTKEHSATQMHTAATARETLEFLWNNYLTLGERVDLESMPPDVLDSHLKQNSPVRPFRIAAWLARQGYFIAAWSLWEYYSRSLCEGLRLKEQKANHESTVDWVERSLRVNAKSFTNHAWFASANCVRNLIAHNGCRVEGPRAEKLLERARMAFPDIETWKDGYLALSHSHMADLHLNVEDFIDEAA
jgi:hypothetical protein